jgi:hypothetical protein
MLPPFTQDWSNPFSNHFIVNSTSTNSTKYRILYNSTNETSYDVKIFLYKAQLRVITLAVTYENNEMRIFSG